MINYLLFNSCHPQASPSNLVSYVLIIKHYYSSMTSIRTSRHPPRKNARGLACRRPSIIAFQLRQPPARVSCLPSVSPAKQKHTHAPDASATWQNTPQLVMSRPPCLAIIPMLSYRRPTYRHCQPLRRGARSTGTGTNITARDRYCHTLLSTECNRFGHVGPDGACISHWPGSVYTRTHILPLIRWRVHAKHQAVL